MKRRVAARGPVVRPALLWLVTTAMVPCALVAQQDPGETAQDWDEVYRSAREAYQTALTARDSLRAAHGNLISERTLAVERGDIERADRLSAEIQEKAEELDSADAELRRLEEEWVDAGEGYIGWIDANRELLTQQLEQRPAGAEEDVRYRLLEQRFDSLTSLRDSVDAEIPRVPLEVPPMPNIEARPEERPAELRRKARIYEDYVEVCTRRIARVGERIRELNRARDLEEAKAALDRGRADLLTAPVGLPPGGLGVAVGDTAVTDLRTLAQRIEDLEALEEQLETRANEARTRVAELLRWAAGGYA